MISDGLHLGQQSDQAQVLPPGQVGVDRRELAGEADPATDRVRLGRDVVPEDRRPALIGFEHGREDPHGGGLPGPVGTEEAEDRPRGHGEIDAVEGDHVAEPLLEPFDLDRCRRPSRLRSHR